MVFSMNSMEMMKVDGLHKGAGEFLAIVRNRWKFGFFMLGKLPSAFFSGVRVRAISPESASVTVPYKWFSQNPFRSTYFACQAMAAEMSTGLLAMMQVHGRKPAVSMLVVKLEGSFHKKATGLTVFTCQDGVRIQRAVEETLATGEGVMLEAESRGMNEAGELVAMFKVTWSFKRRQ